ncbi:hypothetical protein N7455_000907 [Penicillium solitum]|uniref:2EXR domain-containing protein n=1 Tax=Penicillium solitum TaxID=60172 RepID=A0A1V6QCH3_9EURO|nr:uncharacterized protein PENSOL_c083G11121 [Penicillium solitum]KAF4761372.1 hypothetical protein HAV15_007553 [Penicillium sp. str. \
MSTPDLAVSTAGAQTFHPFPRLPPELRLQIWRDALPEKDSPAFTPYKSSGWIPNPASENMDANNSPPIVEWEYHHEFLDQIRVKIPLANVNHEARHAAIEWARKQGIEVIFHDYRECVVFLRPFDPMRDVIWISADTFFLFTDECWGIHTPDISPVNVSIPFKVGRFAVSERVIMDRQCLKTLYNTISTFSGDVIMYIIAGEEPNSTAMFVDHTKVQPRWELCGAHEGEALVWHRNYKRFDSNGGLRILQDGSYLRVLEASREIAKIIIEFMPNINFEIRAVHAVRV